MKKITYKGVEYDNISEFCLKHGLNYQRFYCYYRKGFELDYCIERGQKVKEYYGIESRDHLGQNFISLTAMAKHWNISVQTLSSRLDKGYTIEEALTAPKQKRLYKARTGGEYEGVKINGIYYGSYTEFCKINKLSYQTFLRLKNKGLPLEECINRAFISKLISDYKKKVMK